MKHANIFAIRDDEQYRLIVIDSVCSGVRNSESLKNILNYVLDKKLHLFEDDIFQGSFYESDDDFLDLILPSIRRVWAKFFIETPEILTDYQKDSICFNPNFQCEKHWSELTDYQKNSVCCNPNFQYEKYWNKLTDDQKNRVCRYNSNFDYEKYSNELTNWQKDRVCRYNPNFKYEKYWNELTEYQKYILIKRIVIKK